MQVVLEVQASWVPRIEWMVQIVMEVQLQWIIQMALKATAQKVGG